MHLLPRTFWVVRFVLPCFNAVPDSAFYIDICGPYNFFCNNLRHGNYVFAFVRLSFSRITQKSVYRNFEEISLERSETTGDYILMVIRTTIRVKDFYRNFHSWGICTIFPGNSKKISTNCYEIFGGLWRITGNKPFNVGADPYYSPDPGILTETSIRTT